ncbi:hypothetical protein LCGC14_1013060 [marine sediment metagenome]|uniref:Uncharacterized protein n=1 Tax=marine sediment metagenome TaxID=412755 RepID=A0A0F9NL74_9ZZZZ
MEELMGLLIVAFVFAVLMVVAELGPKMRDHHKNKVMTLTKNRGPLKARWYKLKVDIGRKVRYNLPYNKENRG